jgi:hypothetical protein
MVSQIDKCLTCRIENGRKPVTECAPIPTKTTLDPFWSPFGAIAEELGSNYGVMQNN